MQRALPGGGRRAQPEGRRGAHPLAGGGVCCADPGPVGALSARSRRIRRGCPPARRKTSAAQAVHPQGVAVRRARVARRHRLMARSQAPPLLHYALAPLYVALATLVHVPPAGPFVHPTGLFALAVLPAAWFRGPRAGVVAALLARPRLPHVIR